MGSVWTKAGAAACLTAVVLLAALPCRAIRIGTKFSDIILTRLTPGAVYNLTQLKKIPLAVESRADDNADIVIDVLKPRQSDLARAMKLSPIRLGHGSAEQVPAHAREVGYSDVIISIPNDPALVGRHFQIMLHIQAFPIGGPQFDVGAAGLVVVASLASRLRFSVGVGAPSEIESEKKRKKMLTLNFEFYRSASRSRRDRTRQRGGLERVRGREAETHQQGRHAGQDAVISDYANQRFKPFLEGYDAYPGDYVKAMFTKPVQFTLEETASSR